MCIGGFQSERIIRIYAVPDFLFRYVTPLGDGLSNDDYSNHKMSDFYHDEQSNLASTDTFFAITMMLRIICAHLDCFSVHRFGVWNR